MAKGLIEVSGIRTRRRPRTARRTAQGRSGAALGLSGVVPEHSVRHRQRASAKRGRPAMTAAQKKAVSERMKRYWADRRKKSDKK